MLRCVADTWLLRAVRHLELPTSSKIRRESVRTWPTVLLHLFHTHIHIHYKWKSISEIYQLHIIYVKIMGNYGPAITRHSHTLMPSNPTTMPGLWQTPAVPSLVASTVCEHMADYISHISINVCDATYRICGSRPSQSMETL